MTSVDSINSILNHSQYQQWRIREPFSTSPRQHINVAFGTQKLHML